MCRMRETLVWLRRLQNGDNDAKCPELGWNCIPLAVDSYGQWCNEAHTAFSTLAASLAVSMKVSLTVAINCVYNTLGLVLARQNARALTRACSPSLSVGARELRELGGRS